MDTLRTYLRSQSTISRSAVPVIASALVSNEDVDADYIYNTETSARNLPHFTNPKAFIEGDYLVVFGDAYTTITHVTVVYARDPRTIHLTDNIGVNTTTCELPEHLHQRIVDLALSLYYPQNKDK